MMYLISYDIQETKIRTKVAKLLEKAGMERIQYSVFLGDLTMTKKQKLTYMISVLIAQDSVIFIPLHNDVLSEIEEIGEKLDWEYLKGVKKIMII